MRNEARRAEDSVEAVDIMILESDPREVRAIRRALAGILNRISIFSEHERAVEFLLQRGEFEGERRTPDLVLIDSEMMGDDCYPFVARLATTPRFSETIVVIMGPPDVDRATRARAAGAEWFVGKPVRLETLKAVVDDLEDMGIAVVRARTRRERGPALEGG